MKTFEKFGDNIREIPLATTWLLSDIAEMKGRQQLFYTQSAHKLKTLKEYAVIESAISSNRIEGVEIDNKRIGTVVFGRQHLKDRNEEEIRGYRKALSLIHSNSRKLPLTTDLILNLHRIMRGDIWDAGKFKDVDSDIIETYPDGTRRVRFKTVVAKDTLSYLERLLDFYKSFVTEHKLPELVALAAFNLDFLCIHPFRDGNGRMSRLLLLMDLYSFGFDAGRYVSIEKIIEDTKEQYYETLEMSSHGWHEGKHNPWIYINYILFAIKNLYKEFENKFNALTEPKGAKTQAIISAVETYEDSFTIREIELKCPTVSREMIRVVLKDLKGKGKIHCKGKGLAARWFNKGKIIE